MGTDARVLAHISELLPICPNREMCVKILNMIELAIILFIIHQEHESVSSSSRASFRAGRRTMRARRILVPGQKGTKKLLRHCDSQLVCVWYRYDAESRLHFPTVEPIIEQAS
jgi:hypothetical protein